MKLDELIKIADKIKDENIREKTKELLKNPELKNKSLDYKPSDLEKAPCWIGDHHFYEGGLLDHIYSVTKLSIKMAEHFSDKNINMDHLISAALLHDVSKVFMFKKEGGSWGFTGSQIDHSVWSSCELYSRGFPEEVINIVIEHGGDRVPPNPETNEGLILQNADFLDSALNREEVVLFGDEI